MALKLDFTGLNNIALKEAQRDFKTALEATEEPTRGKPCQPIENALEVLKGLKTAPEAPEKAEKNHADRI